MRVIKGPRIVCFDVDDTLVYWEPNGDRATVIIENNGFKERLEYNEAMVDKVKGFKLAGYTVIVWSQSGAEWAAAVVGELELKPYVDYCLPKPMFCVDDMPIESWMKLIKTEDVK